MWGEMAQDGPSTQVIRGLFEHNGWMDIKLAIMNPTWSNKPSRGQGISRRLNCFFMNFNLVSILDLFQCWEVHAYFQIISLFI